MALPDLFNGVSPAVQAFIRSYCGWHVAPVVELDDWMDGSGSESLFLPTMRLVTLDEISSDGVALVNPEWSRGGFVRHPTRWTGKLRGVHFRIHHGFEDTSELQLIAPEMERFAKMTGLGSVRVGQVQITAPNDPDQFPYPATVRQVLDRYKL